MTLYTGATNAAANTQRYAGTAAKYHTEWAGLQSNREDRLETVAYDTGYAAGSTAVATPPTIGGISPVEGSILSRNTFITLRAVGDALRGAPRSVVISAILGGSSLEEMVFNGTSFTAPYTGGGNNRTNITNGFEFTILRLGGWRGTSVTLRVVAVDSVGQVAKKTAALPDAQYTWQIADSRSNVTPFVGAR
jgi:hypothetical protein